MMVYVLIRTLNGNEYVYDVYADLPKATLEAVYRNSLNLGKWHVQHFKVIK